MNQALIDLQIKVAYLENTVDMLNEIVTQQDKALQDLQAQLKLMYQHLQNNADTGIATFDLLADRPPHY